MLQELFVVVYVIEVKAPIVRFLMHMKNCFLFHNKMQVYAIDSWYVSWINYELRAKS